MARISGVNLHDAMEFNSFSRVDNEYVVGKIRPVINSSQN